MPLILIVDADFSFANDLAAQLADEGVRTMRANCPPHALALLALGTPDAVVLDDGLADAPEAALLALRLRERSVPRLVVSGPDGAGVTEWAEDAAARLQKPFCGLTVLSALRNSPQARAA